MLQSIVVFVGAVLGTALLALAVAPQTAPIPIAHRVVEMEATVVSPEPATPVHSVQFTEDEAMVVVASR